MSRVECAGIKDNHSDRCDHYDSEGYCRKYGTYEKNGTTYGGDDVETITYCTHRTIKGKRINDAMNPLRMERIPRWCEVVFDGQILPCYNEFYCPDGVHQWADGRMYDPVSNRTIMPDGTIRDGEHTELSDQIDADLDRLIKSGGLKRLEDKIIQERKRNEKH